MYYKEGMHMKIQAKVERSHGLEVWWVYVNGSKALGPFMSESLARTKVKQCLVAWNIEKVGGVK